MEKRRIWIDLPQSTERTLTLMAENQKMSLKQLMEALLDRAATEYEETATFNHLLTHYPDGQLFLGEQEHQAFIRWLGVVEK